GRLGIAIFIELAAPALKSTAEPITTPSNKSGLFSSKPSPVFAWSVPAINNFFACPCPQGAKVRAPYVTFTRLPPLPCRVHQSHPHNSSTREADGRELLTPPRRGRLCD